MKTILYIALLFSSLTVISQTENRKKPSIIELNNTLFSNYKLDKHNQYKSFFRVFDTIIGKDTLEFNELYKKNKYWYTYTLKNDTVSTRKKSKKNSELTVHRIKTLEHGLYKMYDDAGRILYENNSINDTADSLSKQFSYYPNGTLEFVAIYNDRTLWNIISYYYPDGSPYYDYGNFKNGVGTLRLLDSNGLPCTECTKTINGTLTAEKKCDTE